MLIAIDFDDTIVTSEKVKDTWSVIKTLKPHAKEVINRLAEEGHTIIINTCRSGEGEEDAKNFLDEQEITYHFINCNIPKSHKEWFPKDCRKIYADIYIDDKNLGGIPNDWYDIYNIIISRHGAGIAI